MKTLINNVGNTDDIKCHLVLSYNNISIDELQDALADEKLMRKRLTVIKYLTRAIKNKTAGKTKF